MKLKLDEHILPDIIATGCTNSITLKHVDFPVPCGKCLSCRKKRRADWSFRLQQEFLSSDSAFFITLTYNDLYLPYRYRKSYQKVIEPKEIISYKQNGKPTYKKKQHFKTQITDKPTLNKKHLQDYIKQIRNKHVQYVSEQLKIKKSEVKNHTKPIRYYAVGEYGSKTYRPHYHILLFNMDIANLTPLKNSWSKGYVDIGSVSASSINYVTKYMHKDFDIKKEIREKPFSLMSKGRKNTPYGLIGYNYLKTNGVHHITTEDLTVKDINGNTQRLPKAFLKRLFTNKEDRIEVSLKSFEEFKANKIKDYQRLLKKHYNNSHIQYMQSIESDHKRKIKTINNNEKL